MPANRPDERRPSRTARLWMLAGVAGTLLAACASPDAPRQVRRLDARDFAGPPGTTDSARLAIATPAPVTAPPPRTPLAVSPVDPAAQADRPVPIRTVPLSEVDGGLDPASVLARPTPPQPTSPADTTTDPTQPSAPATPSANRGQLVDAKVGDINGKPVFASDVLGPLDAQLRAEAAVRPPEAWKREARRVINETLNRMIEAEVLRAEAMSMLPAEQRPTGLRAFFQNLRQDEVRQAGGSAAAVNARLQEEAGFTLDELVQMRAAVLLTRQIIQMRIENRVHISWREIQQEYERRRAEFNPDPVVRFRWIRVRDSRPDDIKAIQDTLASGATFEAAASLPANGNNPAQGGMYEQRLEAAFADSTFFQSPMLNELAVQLNPGEYVGPIVADGFHHWVMLDGIEKIETSLYEAQALIQRERFQEIRDIEVQQFVRRLRERASFTDTTAMTDRLMSIAVDRYLAPPVSTP